jgi:D-glycero-D-manno-heptose 1,7-bisphosphate phosphatase
MIRIIFSNDSTLKIPMIVISNQAAVGKGSLQRTALEEVTARLHETLLSDSMSLDGYYYCPHMVEDGCDCRKPRPAMLRRAAADFDPQGWYLSGTPTPISRLPDPQAVSPCYSV